MSEQTSNHHDDDDTVQSSSDSGQTTAEYALVLLGAAGIAALLLGWAARSGAISSLFDAVLSGVMDHLQ